MTTATTTTTTMVMVEDGRGRKRKIQYTQGALLDANRMHPRRFRQGYWDALYELWRLSWFEWAAPRGGGEGLSVPRPVALGPWLTAIARTDRAMARAYDIGPEGGGPRSEGAEWRGERSGSAFTSEEARAGGEPEEGLGGGGDLITAEFLMAPNDAQLSNQMRISWECQLHADWRPLRLDPRELAHLAGALQRAELITSRFRRARPHKRRRHRRHRRPEEGESEGCGESEGEGEGEGEGDTAPTHTTEIVYFVDPRAALQIQHFLANWVVDQDLRPGPPGCVDQHRALTMGAYKKYVYSGRFAPMMAIRHQTLAAEALERAITDSCVE